MGAGHDPSAEGEKVQLAQGGPPKGPIGPRQGPPQLTQEQIQQLQQHAARVTKMRASMDAAMKALPPILEPERTKIRQTLSEAVAIAKAEPEIKKLVDFNPIFRTPNVFVLTAVNDLPGTVQKLSAIVQKEYSPNAKLEQQMYRGEAAASVITRPNLRADLIPYQHESWALLSKKVAGDKGSALIFAVRTIHEADQDHGNIRGRTAAEHQKIIQEKTNASLRTLANYLDTGNGLVPQDKAVAAQLREYIQMTTPKAPEVKPFRQGPKKADAPMPSLSLAGRVHQT